MESFWCSKKNSIPAMMKAPQNYNPALTPCLKAECEKWDNGECFYIHKVITLR